MASTEATATIVIGVVAISGGLALSAYFIFRKPAVVVPKPAPAPPPPQQNQQQNNNANGIAGILSGGAADANAVVNIVNTIADLADF